MSKANLSSGKAFEPQNSWTLGVDNTALGTSEKTLLKSYPKRKRTLFTLRLDLLLYF